MNKHIDVAKAVQTFRETFSDVDFKAENSFTYGYKAGYKQRSDELIDLLVELEEYFEKRQDADWEGEETGMVPNKEMWFYSQLKEQTGKWQSK